MQQILDKLDKSISGDTVNSIAALDIGGGTQDFLLWNSNQPLENSVKAVWPSPTQAIAARIRRARAQGRDVFLHGWLMGGGAMASAVDEHLKAGLKVRATPQAAASLHDDPARVRAMGVEIADEPLPGAAAIFTTDLNQLCISQMLANFEAPLPERWVVAVCDHGYAPGTSNRKFRFSIWQDFLSAGGSMDDLITSTPPPHLTRMQAIVDQQSGALVMDTAAAALWGALEDPAVADLAREGVCVVNLGNMHTVAFLVKDRRVSGIYEHHTGCLDAMTLENNISRFMIGEISDDEVFDCQGHGCAFLPHASSKPLPVVITGPRRRLAQGLGWRTAVPHGDVMLSGCFGLLAAARAM
jgi:uncharacterized protein (DUF1786 family)